MASPFSSEFWRNEEALLWEALAGAFLAAYLDGIDGGIGVLPTEYQPLVDFDMLNTNALRFAREYRYEWISRINETTMKQVQEAMTDWIQSGDPLDVLEQVLSPIFGKVRAEMIAATEITRIFAEANAQAWKSTGFVSQVRFNTAVDDRVCPLCSPLNGQTFAVDDYGHKPPIHIRCRCFNTPVVDVDAVLSQVDVILND